SRAAPQRPVDFLRDGAEPSEGIGDGGVLREARQRRDGLLELSLMSVVEGQQVRGRCDVLQEQVLAGVALHGLEQARDFLVLERRAGAITEYGFALGRE